MNKANLVEKLKETYKTINVKKLDAIFEMFFNCKTRLPVSQSLAEHRERTGMIIGRRQIERTVKALENLGYELAPLKVVKMTKADYIEKVMSVSTSSRKVVEAVYSNLLSNNRMAHSILAKELSTDEREVNASTVKNIAALFQEFGLKPKKVKVHHKKGPKRSFNAESVILDDGIIRWNNPAKLMPAEFKHLDGKF